VLPAKRHIITRIAKEIKTDMKSLAPPHMFTLYLYTADVSFREQVEQTLVDWKNKKNEDWQPVVQCLYQVFSNLPPFVGECYRVVDSPFDPSLLALTNIITWPTFTTCSQEWQNASQMFNNRKGIVFIVRSKFGRRIAHYSSSPVDSEVLFLPNSKFQVTHHYKPNIICLGQENIREKSFTLPEKDMEKVLGGKSSIIVELLQVE